MGTAEPAAPKEQLADDEQRDATEKRTDQPTPTPTKGTPKSVSSDFVLSQESLDAMQANPAAAVSGLKSGIADGLGVEPSGVEITRTVPDLLGGRRLAEGRRLDATLTVNFDVAVADSAVASRVDSLTSGDASVVESMTSAVESGLAAQNIQVTIVSVDAQQFQDAEIPSTSQRANDPLAPTVPP